MPIKHYGHAQQFLYISYKTRGYVTHFSPNKRYRSHKQPTAITLLRRPI